MRCWCARVCSFRVVCRTRSSSIFGRRAISRARHRDKSSSEENPVIIVIGHPLATSTAGRPTFDTRDSAVEIRSHYCSCGRHRALLMCRRNRVLITAVRNRR